MAKNLAAPFPWFGGKSGAAAAVWAAFGDVSNFVEPFAGSAAMLLAAPEGKRTSTINDADGFVANFWRGISQAPDQVAHYADWPVNETDLFARHSWLVRQGPELLEKLHGDPDYFDSKIAGYWVWGACNWIGSGWCGGEGPWVHDGKKIVDSRKLQHLSAGQGINRKLPHLGNAGRGINRQLPHLSAGRGREFFIADWFNRLHAVLRETRVACGDWSRVVTDSVTTRHGLTAVFLDPPYTKGAMDYTAKGTGGKIADDVRAWCADNGQNDNLRIVLCGHAGEHDELLAKGWHIRKWAARKGYALTDEARQNSKDETLWCSPNCMPEKNITRDLFE